MVCNLTLEQTSTPCSNTDMHLWGNWSEMKVNIASQTLAMFQLKVNEMKWIYGKIISFFPLSLFAGILINCPSAFLTHSASSYSALTLSWPPGTFTPPLGCSVAPPAAGGRKVPPPIILVMGMKAKEDKLCVSTGWLFYFPLFWTVLLLIPKLWAFSMKCIHLKCI